MRHTHSHGAAAAALVVAQKYYLQSSDGVTVTYCYPLQSSDTVTVTVTGVDAVVTSIFFS